MMNATCKNTWLRAAWPVLLAIWLAVSCSTRSGQMAGRGAATGDVAGAQADQARKDRRDAELEKLKKAIGDDAFNGLEALADCKHDVALGFARTAKKSDNKDHALAGLWLEVLSYGDSRQDSQARALFPVLVAKDKEIRSEAQAEETMRRALSALMDIREQYDLPRVCR